VPQLTKVDAEKLQEFISAVQPAFTDAHDAIAYALHAAVLSRGFQLVGLSEKESNIEGLSVFCLVLVFVSLPFFVSSSLSHSSFSFSFHRRSHTI
jgi:hypothetical protein